MNDKLSDAMDEITDLHLRPYGMLKQLLRALDWFDGARPESPETLWNRAIEEVRAMKERQNE